MRMRGAKVQPIITLNSRDPIPFLSSGITSAFRPIPHISLRNSIRSPSREDMATQRKAAEEYQSKLDEFQYIREIQVFDHETRKKPLPPPPSAPDPPVVKPNVATCLNTWDRLDGSTQMDRASTAFSRRSPASPFYITSRSSGKNGIPIVRDDLAEIRRRKETKFQKRLLELSQKDADDQRVVLRDRSSLNRKSVHHRHSTMRAFSEKCGQIQAYLRASVKPEMAEIEPPPMVTGEEKEALDFLKKYDDKLWLSRTEAKKAEKENRLLSLYSSQTNLKKDGDAPKKFASRRCQTMAPKANQAPIQLTETH